MKQNLFKYGLPLVAIAALGSLVYKGVTAPGPLNIADAPLFTRVALPPLNMLVMGRDHKLYYEAYNDASDLDNDGALDVGYKPDQISSYYGYYNSKVCYTTDGSKFVPQSAAGGTNGKQCDGATWSGDFLNYVTTSRMDALRKVLFGGYREVDSATQTILRASYTPQDAHSWGKQYTSVAVDGYDITKYTPLSAPGTGRNHLFAITTLSDNGIPQMRVLRNTTFKIWNWVSIERPVAGDDCFTATNSRVNCVSGSGSATGWQVVPAASLSNLNITTWKRSGNTPGSNADMTTFFNGNNNNNRCGTGTNITQIYATGANNNPFVPGSNSCTHDTYNTLITGTIYASTAGDYSFAVNGDDAIDLYIDGRLVVGWYGDHGGDASDGGLTSHSGTVNLSQGNHTVQVRHRENGGDDYWQLYWKTPNSGGSVSMTNYPLRVEACPPGAGKATLREDNCKVYSNNTSYKPTGILHEYGESNRMFFGLLTGSYQKNTTGGVLHSNMSSFSRELSPTTGQFCLNSNCGSGNDVKGIVHTISTFRMLDFNYNGYQYGCGWITTRPVNEGECWMWGNPVAEMMYETLRYFGGATQPRSEYDINNSSQDIATLALSKPSWKPPYTSVANGGGGYPACSQPTMTVLSDINPSYDYKVPGSHWGSFSGSGDPTSLNGLNVSTEADAIWAAEGGGTRKVFIGESNGVVDNAPTPKDVNNMSTIRGLAPEEPSKQGTYYSASVARFGANHKIGGDKFVRTYSVALASPLPKFDFPVGNGRVTLVPFAKSVRGSSIDASGNFQPTDQIVDFYVAKVANTGTHDQDASVNGGRPYAEFRINYEDVEQGADHDMDAIALYTLEVTATNELKVTLKSEYAAGGIDQHMGYIISGTTDDGVYLEICDLADGRTNDGNRSSCAGQQAYKLNTPPNRSPGYCNTASMPSDCTGLPPTAVRTFSVGTTAGATLLKDPLWYAAKYGNDQGVTVDADGDPTNYFLVTNPLYLREQLTKAFDAIGTSSGFSGSTAVVGARVNASSFLVVPSYASLNDGKDWVGDVTAYSVSSSGGFGTKLWSVAGRLPTTSTAVNDRKVYTAIADVNAANRDDNVREFRATELAVDPDHTSNAEMFNRLGYTEGEISANFGSVTPNQLVAYLRGDRSMEGAVLNSTPFRTRSSIMGDIINSSPVVATKRANYGWAGASGLSQDARTAYTAFVKAKSGTDAREYVYVGANDGMLHAFNDQGDEQFAYVPNGVLGNMAYLANRAYQHRYYVDGKLTLGDALVDGNWKTVLVGGLGAGGRSVYGLDISNPSEFDESNVMWEVTSTTQPDLGYVMGKPVVVPLQNGRWVALFGNGYNSTNGRAGLFVVDIATGAVVKKIMVDDGIVGSETAAGLSELGYNGMGSISAVDTNYDGLVDTVYGGDLHGNMWKFDLSADDEANWGTSYQDGLGNAKPLFIARDPSGNRQPITGGIEIAVGPGTGYMVYFGTGRYFAVGDNGTKDVSSLYAVWDNGTAVDNSRAALVQQTLSAGSNGDPSTRTGSRNSVNYYTHRGWYMDLIVGTDAQGERMIAQPQISEGSILFPTYTPGVTADCDPGGLNMTYKLASLTGAPNMGTVTLEPSGTTVGGEDTVGVGTKGDAPNQNVGLTHNSTPDQAFCNPGDDDCTLPDEDGGSEARCTEVILDSPDSTNTLTTNRVCGRQSWRQLR
ncbi:fimbrial protein [Stenotrophomonas panacihumi]|uniref:Fimbrial protein n=1 Tax=Stenotrophomonas panacihumi TaxID=676599 RepID=A0A0R0AES0_9GAMM|nr:PilC/PilY family type IV pilus protein [Stenotrophomonas panacihumi]KRG43357.1 fimbrial protein [Stenotrophomonas panacihumi]